MERITEFDPAWDRTAEGYGVHGVTLRMVLKGDKGAVNFTVYTNWQLPQVKEAHINNAIDNIRRFKYEDYPEVYFCSLLPMPADLGYHSLTPRYEGQEPMRDSCVYCDGKPCYYDGSGLMAEDMFEVLVREGSEAVWKKLEQRYNDLFED